MHSSSACYLIDLLKKICVRLHCTNFIFYVDQGIYFVRYPTTLLWLITWSSSLGWSWKKIQMKIFLLSLDNYISLFTHPPSCAVYFVQLVDCVLWIVRALIATNVVHSRVEGVHCFYLCNKWNSRKNPPRCLNKCIVL